MKRRLLKLTLLSCFILILTALFTVTASADTYGDLTYTVSGGEVTITDCNEYVTSVTIPSSINGYPVTSIGDNAFYNCSSLTSINIPNGVTSIGSFAFEGCSSLTSISIPDSVTSIGDRAFYYCSRLTYNVYSDGKYLGNVNNPYFVLMDTSYTTMTAFAIHPNTKIIGSFAFFDCSSLTSISIPDSVTSIGNSAFSSCSSLTSINIPDSVTSIGNSAFSSCSSLTSINIPDSVTSIGSDAFYKCSKLTYNVYSDGKYLGNVNNPYVVLMDTSYTTMTAFAIHPNTKIIGSSAFSNCSSLTSISIPDSVTSIGECAFSGCSSLESITLPFVGGSPKSVSDTYQYPFGYIFGTYSYYGCVATTQYYYGSSTISTTNSTYYIPKTLKNVTITGGNIPYGAFYNCSNITSINIPDSVTSIGSYAFYNCSSLTSISIPDSVTSIGDDAFYNCSKLTYNVYSDGKYLGNVNNPYVVLMDTSYTTMTAFAIHPNTKIIGNSAFSGCKSLASITIPDSVTSIGNYAFSGCKSLASITIPDSVTSIGNYAFSGCSSLTSISIGNSVTSIGYDAFYGCSSLTSISIPDSVTSIGYRAFHGCKSLTVVYYYCGTEEQWSYIAIGTENMNLTNATRYYHKYVATITEPTCIDNGVKVTTCEACDLAPITEILPALGHSWSDWEEKVSPTCNKAGFERKVCSACNSQQNRIIMPCHTWGEWVVSEEPTCTDIGSRTRMCQSCGANETEELSPLGHNEITHDAQAPTCTSVGWQKYTSCTRCGMKNNYVKIPALGHSWEEWQLVILPTIDTVGFKERRCSTCSNEEYDYVHLATGDVDGDGELTNTDLSLAVRVLSGWNVDGDIDMMDMNYDGKINNRDIIVFIQKLAGQEPVYPVHPSNLKNRTYVFCKSNVTAKPEISCVSLHFEDEFSFDIYMTCESTCGSGEVCFTEERFTYNGIDFHPIGYGGEGGIDAKVSGNYIVVNAFGNILTLEVLSNDTLRAIAPSDFYSVSAGDIFR